MKKRLLLITLFLSAGIFNLKAALYLCCSPTGNAQYWSSTTLANGSPGPAVPIGNAGGCAGWVGCVEIDRMHTSAAFNLGGSDNPKEATPEMYETMASFTLNENGLTCDDIDQSNALQQEIINGSLEKRLVDLDLINPELALLIEPNFQPSEIKWLKVVPNPVINDELTFVYRSNETRNVILEIMNNGQHIFFTQTLQANKGDNIVTVNIPHNLNGKKVLKLSSESQFLTKQIMIK